MSTRIFEVQNFAKEEAYFYACDLEDAFNKLDSSWLEKLKIPLKDSQSISAFDQFKAYFRNRRLAYPKTDLGKKSAGDMLSMIFYNNLLLIEQISKSREVINQIANFDNWADEVKSGVTTQSKQIGEATTLNYQQSTEKTGSTNATLNKNSDDNSYSGEDTGIVPINALSKQTGLSLVEGSRSSKDANTSASQSVGDSQTASVTRSSNAAKDYIEFLKLDPQNLLFKFWKKFEILFYRT